MSTLVCKILLDKTAGILVEISNADGKITQTLAMDGTSIITKVKGDSATSTITQKADSISIECQNFSVKAETVTVSSTKASQWKSDDTLALTSQKDLTIKSSAALVQSAQSDASFKALNVKVEAQSALQLKATDASIKGSAQTALQGAQVNISADAQLAAKGPMVKISGDAMLSLESAAVATLKGSITNVQGTLVKLGP